MDSKNIKIKMTDEKGQLYILEKEVLKSLKKNRNIELHQRIDNSESEFEINLKDHVRLIHFAKENPLILTITLFLATCSILYEMILAQSLATTTGQTLLAYNLTIGLYIFFMGLGSFLSVKVLKQNKTLNRLISIELTLSLIGLLTPIAIVSWDALFHYLNLKGILQYQYFFTQCFISLFNYSLIALIGILTGLEVPLLANLLKSKSSRDHSSSDNEFYILAIDYFGSFLGAILFPFIFVPLFNLFTISSIVSFINFSMAFLLFVYGLKTVEGKKKFFFIFPILFISYWAYFLYGQEQFNHLVANKIYFMGIQ